MPSLRGVDPSQILKGQFDLIIDTADGSSTFEALFHGKGKAGRYATPTWICPAGIHHALLWGQIVRGTVRKGAALRFSMPMLQERGSQRFSFHKVSGRVVVSPLVSSRDRKPRLIRRAWRLGAVWQRMDSP